MSDSDANSACNPSLCLIQWVCSLKRRRTINTCLLFIYLLFMNRNCHHLIIYSIIMKIKEINYKWSNMSIFLWAKQRSPAGLANTQGASCMIQWYHGYNYSLSFHGGVHMVGSTLSTFRTAALIVLSASSDSYISDWWVELYLTRHIPVTWNSERLYAQTAAASTSVDLWTQFIFSQHVHYPIYQNGSHLWREKETLNKC